MPHDPHSPLGRLDQPDDGGLSLDRLAQAFAAMMGTGDPYAAGGSAADGVEIDASPDLDAAEAPSDAACRVAPKSILEAMLFVGLPGGEPVTSRRVAGLMRGVRPQEIDELAAELRADYAADRRPYEVVATGAGWVMRLRKEFEQFGSIVEERTKTVRLDRASLDVLAAVAWNQPVSREQLLDIGCDPRPATLRLLVRRGLLELRREESAQPTYSTTQKFLDLFKLTSVRDLPKPDAPPA